MSISGILRSRFSFRVSNLLCLIVSIFHVVVGVVRLVV